MQTVNVKSSNVEYFVDGDGPALLLIHGTGGNAESNWAQLVDRISARRTVIRPNYSGSGNTTSREEILSVEAIAEQIIACADAKGVSRFDLAGFSLGAAVAGYIAGEYPDRVRRLVLLAGFSTSRDSRLKFQFELWKRLILSDRKAAAELIILTGFSPAFISKLSEDALAQAVVDIVSNNNWEGMLKQVELDLSIDVTAQIKKISSPTLSIGCTHDHMVAPEHARELAKLIPGARYVELPSGHLAPLEVPDQFVTELLDFLDRPLS